VPFSRFREHGAPVYLVLAFVFPAIIGAAAALAYYGYLYAEDVSRRIEASFRTTARGEATRLFETVEARVDEATRIVLDQIVKHPETEERPCGFDSEPAVDAYVIVHFGARSTLITDCHSGRKLPWAQYLRAIDFRAVQSGSFRYVHHRFDLEYVLLAYARKQTARGDTYYVVARLKPAAIVGVVGEEVAKLSGQYSVTVVDWQARPVVGAEGGRRVGGDDRFRLEVPFGKTLYTWRLQIAPKDVEALQAQAERQKVIGPLLVILSAGIIGVGLVIVWLSVLSERRASRLKSDFIANVSHELKTPLSLIRMFGEMVATGRHKDQEAAREYGAIITRESERLSHLIDNVLDFARLERGKASYHFAEGDLAEVIERALDVCRYRLDKERIRLLTAIDPSVPHVRMDENALTLVVLNLVDNAIKHAADGRRVDVYLDRMPGGVVLRVRDFGNGIPMPERERIFERFYRARDARERNVRGSGIGLSLVRHIAEAHGGRVTVEDPAGTMEEPGRGSVFCVYLPATTTRQLGVDAAAAAS
jgi:two-component system phosphate regulon sensor histidine kinase PhoR